MILLYKSEKNINTIAQKEKFHYNSLKINSLKAKE